MTPGQSLISSQAVDGASSRQSRFVELDSLRGVAALIVVLHHLRLMWQGEVQPASGVLRWILAVVNPAGNGAVILFFVLSGFVLSLPAVKGKPQTYLTFAIRRIFRIYVPYLVALAVSVAGAFWLHGMITRNSWFNQTWSDPVKWKLVAQHVMFLGVYSDFQFDPPIWSLVYEMRISLIFPFLCALVLIFRSRWSLVIAFALTAAAGLIQRPPLQVSWPLAETVHLAGLFVFGILLARERNRLGGWCHRRPLLFSSVIAVATSGGLLLYLFSNCRLAILLGGLFPNSLTCIRHWLIAIASGALMIFSINSPSWKSVLLWPPIHFLGEISYSLYLWHFIVMLYCVHLLYGTVPLFAILCLALVLSIIVSRCSYLWVEVPAMNIGRRISNVFQRPAGAGVRSTESATLTNSS